MSTQTSNNLNSIMLAVLLGVMGWNTVTLQGITTVLPVMDYRIEQLENKT
ncbi:hypothetical protein [Oceanospirillum maris]|nr:hypothetical protein [Oceanospirillum maris]